MYCLLLGILCLFLTLYILDKYFSGTSYQGQKLDLTGKYAVITGGCSGIGLATVINLAKQGCNIIVGDIDSSTFHQRVSEIKGNSKKQIQIMCFFLDLGNLNSIKQFTKKIGEKKISYLINNAGIMGIPDRELTDSGYEKHCGINYIGHFYLTHLLWDKLNHTDGYRIINVSSIAHKRILGFFHSPVLDLDDINFDNSKYSPHQAYSLSKFYIILFTKALAQKIGQKSTGVTVSLHPGVARSNILKYLMPGWKEVLMRILDSFYSIFTKSCDEASQTTIMAVNEPRQNLVNGGYYSDCKECSPSQNTIPQNWHHLWTITQKQLKIDFGSSDYQ